MKPKYKIVFLDFDGVLNDCKVINEAWRQVRDGHITPVDHGWPPGWAMIDEQNVAQLQRIINATGAKIVISSAWRTVHTLEELAEFLKSKGLTNFQIIDKTPVKGAFRGEEVALWMENQDICEVESFVILDDHEDFYVEQHPYFVQSQYFLMVEDKGGLLPFHADNAIRILLDTTPPKERPKTFPD